MNFFPFHIGDYAFHTRHLTPMEDLAYRRTLDLYYSRDGDLPDGVARLIGLPDCVAEVASVMAEFFPAGKNKRADEEIEKMHAKQENARASVAKRTAHASVTQASRKRHALQQTNTNNQEPITKKEKKPSASRERRCPQDFDPAPLFASMQAECPGLDLLRETAKFRDFEFQTLRSDWAAAWRNWMRKSYESRPKLVDKFAGAI